MDHIGGSIVGLRLSMTSENVLINWLAERNRTWDTRVGTMELHIPKLREGSYFPSLLEPRRRSEKALLAVIQQAYPSAGSGQAWRACPLGGWTI